MHGHVGHTLQALGVGEGPLDTASVNPPGMRSADERGSFDDRVNLVCLRAVDFARQTGSRTVGTVHVLFAVLHIYGWAFYRWGTSRDEVFERLAGEPVGSKAHA